MILNDITRKLPKNFRVVIQNIYSRHFSEVGLITKRFNFILNFFFNAKLIIKDKAVCAQFTKSFRQTSVQHLDDLNQKLDQLKTYGYCQITIDDFPTLSTPVEELRKFFNRYCEYQATLSTILR